MGTEPEPLPDQLDELLHSEACAAVQERITKMLEGKRLELESTLPIEQTQYLRGFIAGIRTCLKVPEILLEESKQEHR